MAEVEAQLVGPDLRALLRDMRAEHAAQRLVQQMGGGVVCAGGRATHDVDVEVHDVADLQRAAVELAEMDVHVAELLLGVVDRKLGSGLREHRARVADLATGLSVERRLVDDHLAFVAGFQLLHRRAAFQQGRHDAFSGFRVVAQELGSAELFAQFEPDRFRRGFARACPGRARVGFLLGHGGIEAGPVHADAAAAQCVLGQVIGEAERVIEAERDVARQDLA